jgi:hypothetical protein
MIKAASQSIEEADYFEFIKEFVSTFKLHLFDEIVDLVSHIVNRVKISLHSSSDSAQQIMQQCINVLRKITDTKEIVTKLGPQIEIALIPVLELMADPSKINFEDDLLVIIKNLIRRQETVSETLFKVFFTSDKILAKNK